MTQRLDYREQAPGGMKALDGVSAYVAQCGLEKTLIDLVYLRASQINGCAYCIDLHTRDLLVAGVAIEKVTLAPAWREAGELFTDREKAALAWAESVTRVAETGAPDAAYAAAAAHFSERSWPTSPSSSR